VAHHADGHPQLRSRGLRQAIVGHFADGRLHTLGEVTARCGHLIPPEIAVRNYLRRRNADLGLPRQAQIDRGRRWLVATAIRMLGAKPGGQRGGRYVWSTFTLDPVKPTARPRGEQRQESKLTDELVREIWRHHRDGLKGTAIAAILDRPRSTINSVLCGRTWGHVKLTEE
jgi:hypothetical protein